MYTKEEYFKIQDAIKFLCKSMEKAEDRNKPELLHSLHVGFRLMDYNYDVDLVLAGFLHDILEEGQCVGNIQNLFGNKVWDLVNADTKDENIEGWEKQYEQLFVNKLANNNDALIIKAVDVLDNFIHRFDVNDELGKKKVIFLSEQLFKYTNSEDKVFGDLRKIYNEKINNI